MYIADRMPTSSKARARSRPSKSTPKAQPRSRPAPKCYLVTIPPEIRSSILRQLLVQPDAQGLSRQVYDDRRVISRPWLEVSWISSQEKADSRARLSMLRALTQTCKLFYFESVALYYSTHGLVFYSVNSLGATLKGLGPGRRQHIRDVTFSLVETPERGVIDDGKQPSRATTLLGECNLRKLKVVVNNNTGTTVFRHNLLRVPGVKRLRDIRGCQEVCVEQTQLTIDEIRWGYQLRYTDEQVETFQKVLRAELCQEREQAREVVTEIVVEEDT